MWDSTDSILKKKKKEKNYIFTRNQSFWIYVRCTLAILPFACKHIMQGFTSVYYFHLKKMYEKWSLAGRKCNTMSSLRRGKTFNLHLFTTTNGWYIYLMVFKFFFPLSCRFSKTSATSQTLLYECIVFIWQINKMLFPYLLVNENSSIIKVLMQYILSIIGFNLYKQIIS